MTTYALPIAVAVVVVVVGWFLFGRRNLGETRALPRSVVTTMNWMRGLAAVAVLVGHVRGLFLQDFESLERPSVAWKAFYLVSGLGHQAVMIFFILSGFLVGSTVLAQNAEGRWQPRDYFFRRIARLYVVLVPGLLLTAAWDSAGMHFFGTEGLYGGVINAPHLAMPDVRATQSWGHFIGNLVFLQHLFIAPFGSNSPLWSLSYEFWAYMLFPLLVRAGSPSLTKTRRGAYLVLACAGIAVGGWKMGLYFSVWLIGAGLALWWRRTGARSVPRWSMAGRWAMFGGAIMLARLSKAYDIYTDILLGIVSALLLAGLLLRGHEDVRALNARAASTLADFSYTLYVGHYPVLTFVFAAAMGGDRSVPSSWGVASMLGICGALLLYAYSVAQITEAHTEKVRRWLRGGFRTLG